MVNDDILGKRLNDFKNKPNLGNKIPQLPSNPVFTLLVSLLTGMIFLFKTFIYGYSIKLIFATDWYWWQFICIGMALNFLLTYIYDLIYSIHNKS